MTQDEILLKCKELLKMKFDVRETLEVLTYDISKFWSWGSKQLCNIDNKGLIFKVNGHHHKGWVLITLDWTDTYTVHIISNSGVVLDTYEMVYFDDLFNRIDVRIEKIPEYVR